MKIILLCFIIPLIAAITGLCICTVLAFSDNISDKYTIAQQDGSYHNTVLKGAVTGKSFDLSQTEVNTWLNKKYCVPKDDGLYNLMVYFHKDRPSEVYARVRVNGHFLALSAELTLSADGNGTVTAGLQSARAGELPIPDPVLSRILSKVFVNNSKISTEDTRLHIDAGYTYELKHSTVSIHITELEPGEGIVHCRTNSLTAEALHALIDYLASDEGQEKIFLIYNGIKDKLGSLFY